MKQLMKIIAVVLTLVLTIGAFVGCGETDDGSGAQDSGTNSSDQMTDADSTDSSDSADNAEPVELTLLMSTDATRAGLDDVITLAEEKLNMKIIVELRPGGAEGDNVIKTRLASGEMADLCFYNSGSLLAALNPSEYFIDLSEQSFIDRIDDTYRGTVTIDEEVYGIPFESTQAGAILYSKPIYEELGLSVPKTWDEFIANCDAIEAAGMTPIYGSFADSWTAQVMYLGDHYSVATADPDFASEFEAGNVKYATHEAGLRSWEKLEETVPYYNADNLAATYHDGCDVIANAEAGHWVMLTQALSNIYELYGDKVNDIGVFGIPNDDPENMGLTVWMPTSLYGNKNSENVDAILKFMEFYISDEALDAYAGKVLPNGPYAIKGYTIPENGYEPVRIDMQKYFDEGKTVTALEFQTPIKGPNCPAISQELAAGQTTALEAAKAYDDDCLKQAIQLGYDWN